jgi:hypothetical protein
MNFIRNLDPGLVLLALALSSTSCVQSPIVVVAFRTEQQAQDHCPDDTVIWLDPVNGIYYVKGHQSYGRTDSGRYACHAEVDRAGMHEMTNQP